MTACWSKGLHKTYPFCLCPTRGCASCAKSIRLAEIEGDFTAILEDLRPSPGSLNVAARVLRKIWDARLDGTQTQSRSLETELRATDKKVDKFLDRIAETDIPSSIGANEKQNGAPDRIRTCDLWTRNPTLYPAELRVHVRTQDKCRLCE